MLIPIYVVVVRLSCVTFDRSDIGTAAGSEFDASHYNDNKNNNNNNGFNNDNSVNNNNNNNNNDNSVDNAKSINNNRNHSNDNNTSILWKLDRLCGPQSGLAASKPSILCCNIMCYGRV